MWPASEGPGGGEDALPEIASLTVEPARGPADVREEVNHLLGIGLPRVRYKPEYPGIAELRKELGL